MRFTPTLATSKMRIYPPFKKWTTEIKNLEEFELFIKKGFKKDYGSAKVDALENGFIIERSTFVMNRNRPPRIRGFVKSQEGKEILTLTIEQQKYIFPVLFIMPLFILISSIFTNNYTSIYFVPVVFAFFYIMGLLIHLSMLDKTLKILHVILKKASS